jgi:hypothetical protein
VHRLVAMVAPLLSPPEAVRAAATAAAPSASSGTH